MPWFSSENIASVQTSRLLFAILFLAAWEFGADRLFDSFFFSTPMRILAQVAREVVDPGFYRDLGVTSLEMAVGFTVGAGSGIDSAYCWRAGSTSQKCSTRFSSRSTVPRIALAPCSSSGSASLFVEDIPRATLVFFITFNTPPASAASTALCDIARVMKATEWQVFRRSC